MQPQRLMVPLFQRPYVWNEENQWDPLWTDLTRLAERQLANPSIRQQPHFLGAVVLQQTPNQSGLMQQRTIIDGQQRLTTLQLLFDALHAELLLVEAGAPAARVEPLINNADAFRQRPEDRFKVWPTNRDRAAFNAVMAAEPPVDYEALGVPRPRIVEAHRFFGLRAREWLAAGAAEQIQTRAVAIETAARELLQVVVIDLASDENAQEIFETLNARGAQLTAADLIKNFVFQRLLEAGADVEHAYDKYWKDFETAFWEAEISVGRLRYPRSSIFLNHWLVARTGEEIVAREVFNRFKVFADFEAKVPILAVLEQVKRAADLYRSFVTGAEALNGPIDRLGLFGYRTGVMESEVVKPLVLHLLDREFPPVPPAELAKAVDSVESWMVRRMLVRASTKSYNQVVAELIAELRAGDRAKAGTRVEAFLQKQTSANRHWPDDDEVRRELRSLPVYRRLGRGRLRMVIEAVEDHLRGWGNDKEGLGGERVARGKLHIEHVMPRKWEAHWPLPSDLNGDGAVRVALIHTIGNLTLLPGRLNAKVSNGPWVGAEGKRQALESHDVFHLNRDLLKDAGDSWNEHLIRRRSEALGARIVATWPTPPGHRVGVIEERVGVARPVDLADLLSAGLLVSGMRLFPRQSKDRQSESEITLLADGRIDVDGKVHESPTDAARAIRKSKAAVNGWWFLLVDAQTKRSLRDVRREYLETQVAAEPDSDDDGEDEP